MSDDLTQSVSKMLVDMGSEDGQRLARRTLVKFAQQALSGAPRLGGMDSQHIQRARDTPWLKPLPSFWRPSRQIFLRRSKAHLSLIPCPQMIELFNWSGDHRTQHLDSVAYTEPDRWADYDDD